MPCRRSSWRRFSDELAAAPDASGRARPAFIECMNTTTQKATFAAGCFWGVEAAFRQLPGVIDAISGYTGGRTANPT